MSGRVMSAVSLRHFRPRFSPCLGSLGPKWAHLRALGLATRAAAAAGEGQAEG